MEDDSNDHGFMLPESFLTQLNEYSRGYILLVCNERGELFAHEGYDNPVIKLGLINFAEMHIAAAVQHMQNMALKQEEEMEGTRPPPEDDDEDDD